MEFNVLSIYDEKIYRSIKKKKKTKGDFENFETHKKLIRHILLPLNSHNFCTKQFFIMILKLFQVCKLRESPCVKVDFRFLMLNFGIADHSSLTNY